MITPQSVTNGALAGGDCHVNEVFCDDCGTGEVDCHGNAPNCDKWCSEEGNCHVNEVFCDDWCDELIFPQEDIIRRLRVVSQ